MPEYVTTKSGMACLELASLGNREITRRIIDYILSIGARFYYCNSLVVRHLLSVSQVLVGSSK